MPSKRKSSSDMMPAKASRSLPGISCILLAALLLSGCEPGILNPQGPVGTADKTILIDSLAIMLAIVIPTICAILGFAWWFRASHTKARHLPDWEFSGRIEMVVWAVPAMVVILLSGVAWIGAHQLDPAKPLESKTAPLEVQVVSLDWKWLFIYPQQQIASVNHLEIPVGVPVHFTLTSGSVMNAFFIPQLGSMIYTMNGMTTQLFLQSDKAGTYRGMSSHYSGDGFSGMRFGVDAVSAAQFANWAASAKGRGQRLDTATYAALAKQSMNVAPYSYGVVDPALFDSVVMQTIPPAAGPVDSSVQHGAKEP